MSHLRSPRGYGQANTLGDQNWSLKATYVEIYNEQLRDLLAPDSTPLSDRHNVAIREDVKGNIILTGLHQVDITSVEDLMNALNHGSTIRQTDSTAINAKSSRSHAVFSLNLVQRKTKASTTATEKRFSVPLEAMSGSEVAITTDSKLHFVDLAGSERLKNTGAHGDRAKEGISINAGLASLGKVISQLSSRQPGAHVSYRDSKLTRLLQDSLGGNAITYMIACVTPAEFHLSETLNTLQYAQRARAIQSKPRIQQVEEGDKQAIIDRLKAEVAFLREQMSNSSHHGGSPRRLAAGSNDKSDRQTERESELQNQLLDTQENYNALGQRYAKLIAEMARARENENSSDMPIMDEFGASATDRLNRSNSFAQAVEQVVLEYEKTIQSLEQSLSSTRSNLSNAESNLLEKETRCAYAEAINTQLTARLTKLIDREASTENYLHDLETKLDGHTSGEEKNAAIIIELRKEIARGRENEASCEEYISTLEEHLAKSDQDVELMQREIDRLEEVVERQRSLGKLDSLLHELDDVNEAKQTEPEQREPTTNGTGRRRSSTNGHSRVHSHVSRHSGMEDPIPEDEVYTGASDSKIDTVKEEVEEGVAAMTNPTLTNGDGQSSAQSKYVADKLENVTQELIGLRVDHETTINEYDLLHAKYEEAMRRVAELQDTVDEARHSKQHGRDSVMSHANGRPDSFLAETTRSDSKHGLRSSASRSLSSELSSAMYSPVTAGTSNGDITDDDETATTKPGVSTEDLTANASRSSSVYGEGEEKYVVQAELLRLKALADERELAERELAGRYAELESRHADTLEMVEDLKTEVSKARATEASSPRTSTPVIRRKSSQNLLMDRAHRSFASLRNIAADNFSGNPDTMQNFEVNLNAAMHELHSRSERIQELEADVAAAKKEMETKMTIISGLTRERSSLQASPMDMSMVANLRERLEQSEKQMSLMRQAHASREEELANELETLRNATSEPKVEETLTTNSETVGEERRAASTKTIAQLEAELSEWEMKHKAALESVSDKEGELRATIEELETHVATLDAKLTETQGLPSQSIESEQKQQNLLQFLRNEIDEYKAIINSNATKVAELETAHSKALFDLEEMTKVHGSVKAELDRVNEASDIVSRELADHKLRASNLEEQIATHEEIVKTHHMSMEDLKATHVRALSDLKTREQKDYEDQVEVLLAEQAESVQRLEKDLATARDELEHVATRVATSLGVYVSVDKLNEHISELISRQDATADQNVKAKEMESHVAELTKINDTVMYELESAKEALAELVPDVQGSILRQVDAVKTKLSDLEGRIQKNSRLIEELEDQLQNNFDEAQMTSNRLSTLQSERNSQIEEASHVRSRMQAEMEVIREEYASLQVGLTV